MEKLKNVLNGLDKPRILDVGTGGGAFISMLTQLYDGYDSIIGVDTSERAITAANKNFDEDERISFSQTDGSLDSFTDDSFDVVCLSNSIHHLREPDVVFSEMKRVLKKEGFLLINEMVADNLDEKQESHKKLHHFAAEIDREFGDFHDETYSKNKILKILSKYGMVMEYWELGVERIEENSPDELKWMMDTIERVLKRTESLENYDEYKMKANEVKEYIKKHGYDRATSLVVLMKN